MPGCSLPLRITVRRLDVQHPDLAGQHHEAVIGHPVPAGTQPVAVEHGADHRAVGERDQAGPSHGSISEAWNR